MSQIGHDAIFIEAITVLYDDLHIIVKKWQICFRQTTAL